MIPVTGMAEPLCCVVPVITIQLPVTCTTVGDFCTVII